jgi:fumarylacetoacetase
MNVNSILEQSKTSDFSIKNIPFGIANTKHGKLMVSRLGEYIFDVYSLLNYFGADGVDKELEEVLKSETLNSFIGLGKKRTNRVREQLQWIFENQDDISDEIFHEIAWHHSQVKMILPIHIGDYTDFYSSLEHATNIGKMFRDPSNPLLPNWLHMPIGYHGRSSSIIVSGTEVKRPSGQYQVNDGEVPQFGPSRTLDIELEMGFIIGKESKLGEPISINDAEQYIFGMVLFNDWSARDIQRWEYVPLGPFLGKNFASTISPWVVTMEALEEFRVEGPNQTVEVLPYLKFEGHKNYDINLEVELITSDEVSTTICKSNFKYMYWNMCQQLAHHTVNGCNVRVGDLCASGTISGPTQDSFGSLIELTWKGSQPLKMNNGEERKFLQNGDTINIKGFNITKDGFRIGFGDCLGKIV